MEAKSVPCQGLPSKGDDDPPPSNHRLLGPLLSIGDTVVLEKGEERGLPILSLAYSLVLARVCDAMVKRLPLEEIMKTMMRNMFGFIIWEFKDEDTSQKHGHSVVLHIFPKIVDGSLEYPHCHKRNWSSINMHGTYQHILYSFLKHDTGEAITPDLSLPGHAAECPQQNLKLFEHEMETGCHFKGPVRVDAVQEFTYKKGVLQYMDKRVPHRLDKYENTFSLNVRGPLDPTLNTLFTVLNYKPLPQNADKQWQVPLSSLEHASEIIRLVTATLADPDLSAFAAMGGDAAKLASLPIDEAFRYAVTIVSGFEDRFPLVMPLDKGGTMKAGVVTGEAVRGLVYHSLRTMPEVRVPEHV
ncbi:unnamed protein product [Vitrella brassicaformis CCMP3155]|uniref:Uncharacterized protein n=2 Tax=Vitrella brassicaformis TaxID=1169539 RepID=A0A0G4F0M8_VITBC|nr:unnamed protein product [Vitrella brassicaformis CCMP3155]|eukprot:CEM05401.1 unnamed protein product [Vitrella brassicaformis CCMP3155]